MVVATFRKESVAKHTTTTPSHRDRLIICTHFGHGYKKMQQNTQQLPHHIEIAPFFAHILAMGIWVIAIF